MFNNCKKYNTPKSEVYEDANTLSKLVAEHYTFMTQSILDSSSSRLKPPSHTTTHLRSKRDLTSSTKSAQELPPNPITPPDILHLPKITFKPLPPPSSSSSSSPSSSPSPSSSLSSSSSSISDTSSTRPMSKSIRPRVITAKFSVPPELPVPSSSSSSSSFSFYPPKKRQKTLVLERIKALIAVMETGPMSTVMDLLHRAPQWGPNTLLDVPFPLFNMEFQWAPIHMACYYGQLELIHYFFVHEGAFVELQDTWYGGTPLSWAVFGGQYDVASYLIYQQGADKTRKNSAGQSLLEIVPDPTNPRWIQLLTSSTPTSSSTLVLPTKLKHIKIKELSNFMAASTSSSTDSLPTLTTTSTTIQPSSSTPLSSLDRTLTASIPSSSSSSPVTATTTTTLSPMSTLIPTLTSSTLFSSSRTPKMLSIYQTLVQSKDKSGRFLSLDFLELPSKQWYPDYYDAIVRPLSFHDLHHFILNPDSDYTWMQFRLDWYTLFYNAMEYNVDTSLIFKDAVTLLDTFKKEWKKIGFGEPLKRVVEKVVFKVPSMTKEVEEKEHGMSGSENSSSSTTEKVIEVKPGQFMVTLDHQVMLVEKTGVNEDDVEIVQGTCFFTYEQVKFASSYYPNEIFKCDYISCPASYLVRPCFVIWSKDFHKGMPKGYSPEDIFVCESKVHARSFTVIKDWLKEFSFPPSEPTYAPPLFPIALSKTLTYRTFADFFETSLIEHQATAQQQGTTLDVALLSKPLSSSASSNLHSESNTKVTDTSSDEPINIDDTHVNHPVLTSESTSSLPLPVPTTSTSPSLSAATTTANALISSSSRAASPLPGSTQPLSTSALTSSSLLSSPKKSSTLASSSTTNLTSSITGTKAPATTDASRSSTPMEGTTKRRRGRPRKEDKASKPSNGETEKEMNSVSSGKKSSASKSSLSDSLGSGGHGSKTFNSSSSVTSQTDAKQTRHPPVANTASPSVSTATSTPSTTTTTTTTSSSSTTTPSAPPHRVTPLTLGPRLVPYLHVETPGRHCLFRFTSDLFHHSFTVPSSCSFLKMVPLTFPLSEDTFPNVPFGVAILRAGRLVHPRFTQEVSQMYASKLRARLAYASIHPSPSISSSTSTSTLGSTVDSKVDVNALQLGPLFESELLPGLNVFEVWATAQKGSEPKQMQLSYLFVYRA